MPEPDCFLQYRIGYGTLQPCLGCQRVALLRGILRREIPTYTYWLRAARASRGFKKQYSKTLAIIGLIAMPLKSSQFSGLLNPTVDQL